MSLFIPLSSLQRFKIVLHKYSQTIKNILNMKLKAINYKQYDPTKQKHLSTVLNFVTV